MVYVSKLDVSLKIRLNEETAVALDCVDHAGYTLVTGLRKMRVRAVAKISGASRLLITEARIQDLPNDTTNK